jgi:hypothetical protein
LSNHTLSAIGQVAYPTFITARKRNATAKPRWSVTLVYDQSISLEAMKARVAECVLKEYPNGPPGGFRSPFRSGADKRRDDGSMPAGFKETDTFCEFWRYEEHGKVPLVDQFRNELLPSDTYAGMTGRVSFNPFCYSTDGNKGVALGLEAFQKAADGTPVGAAPVDPQAVFDDIGEAPAPTPSVADIFK